MNIVMLTNTYLPHVGGVARSVAAFVAEYRRRGHRVLVVAPEFENQSDTETEVVRIPAIQQFNGSDFSAVLPVSGLLTQELDVFMPDIVHAHHPYLLGMTAMRIARYRALPLVFTHHTLYEQYTHYVPMDSPVFRRFVIELASHYANLCDQVFAPSQSIAELLRGRGVESPIAIIPTGVELEQFARGDRAGFRQRQGIPAQAFVVGHLGRLAPEKNMEFLTTALIRFLTQVPEAHFLLVGEGPAGANIHRQFERAGLAARLHHVGILQSPELAAAYHAMDVFAFASKSETQGMVLTEAMAAGVPVVGLDAPGVREVVHDRLNGRLLHGEDSEAFAAALQWLAQLSPPERQQLRQGAGQTAEDFSMSHTAGKALACYEVLVARGVASKVEAYEQWERVIKLIKAEWDIIQGMAAAAGTAFTEPDRPASSGS